MSSYVIITPAHDEEAFVARAIESVLNQTLRPLTWIVVNDASTDSTERIVAKYAARHPFITLLNVRRPAGRHFANKVRAFNFAVAQLADLNYSYIGNLDADISLEKHYFASIIAELEHDVRLGIAGGMVWSRSGTRFVSQNVALDSVAGAVQMFRRRCLEDIGGLSAFPCGGEDSAAEIKARMKGWRVLTFPEYRAFEHRITGHAAPSLLASRIREGRRFHALGYGLLFYSARCFRRSLERPRLLGSAAAFLGFLTGRLAGDPILLSSEVTRFLRAEQRQKLLTLCRLSR